MTQVIIDNLQMKHPRRHFCACCGEKVRLMCETDYCGQRCREGECGHANHPAAVR